MDGDMDLKGLRITFLTLSLILGLLFGLASSSIIFPMSVSAAVAALVISGSKLLKETSLKSLNIIVLGLFVGYLITHLFMSALMAIDGFHLFEIAPSNLLFIKLSIYLICSYLGMVFVWQAQDNWTLSIPFVRLMPLESKKRDFLIDSAVLTDPRLIDLAATGLFDHRLILPRFILQECKRGLEQENEVEKQRNKRAIEIVQKLEEVPGLELRIDEHDFFEVKEPHHKLIQLARLLDAHILTSDPSGLNARTYEGVKWINLLTLSNALKPVVQTGETIPIKIQRYGKEPLQGVGYLDDGTMVVVNGGSEHLGETIQVQVLSVKHTPTGRMIFCNSAHEKRSALLKSMG